MHYWYGYLDEALGWAEGSFESDAIADVRRNAADDGAPTEVLDHIDGLLRTFRYCRCGEICWCDIKAATDRDFERIWHTNRMPVNICHCDHAVNPADTEELEAHRHCHPGM